MYVIRPIEKSDFQAYTDLAFSAKLGMLSLPKDLEKLKTNIDLSLKSFSTPLELRKTSFYLFVLENVPSKQVGGICGIYASIGVPFPHYYYQKECIHLKPCPSLPLAKELHLLRPIAISEGPSELCSLFLTANFRKEGLGKLLSLSRFLFMARFPERFEEEIMAEMRGFINLENTNPFWEQVGKKFLSVSYQELIQMQHQGLDFVPYVLPEYPLYIELLPKEAQEVIGQIHPNTHPAFAILKKEGFTPCGLYDIFDAGPILKAKKNEIRSIVKSRSAILLDNATSLPESPLYILSNDKTDFRACLSPIQFKSRQEAFLPAAIADSLMIQPGDPFRYLEVVHSKTLN